MSSALPHPDGPPTAGAQQALLDALLAELRPVLRAHRLPREFALEPGVRLRRRYGMYRATVPPAITVRCTADGARRQWRRPSAIVSTLVHELAHLRHRGHSAAFWRLCRSLLDDAARLGLYASVSDDPAEQPQGRSKLAGSAADGVLAEARTRQRERARVARQLVAGWPIGAWGQVRGLRVQVLAQRRTRLLVQTREGRRYLVSAPALERLPGDSAHLPAGLHLDGAPAATSLQPAAN